MSRAEQTVLIQQVLESTAAAGAEMGLIPGAPLMGECLEERHPVLAGRVKIGWTVQAGSAPREAWLPCLQGLVVRTGDRVLMTRPANHPEPLVTGVLDGLHRPPPPPLRRGPAVGLRADEAVVVTGARGAPLLEVREGANGPLLRLLSDDLDLELPGRLRLSAADILLEARRGGVKVKASDDVVVEGEMIQLN